MIERIIDPFYLIQIILEEEKILAVSSGTRILSEGTVIMAKAAILKDILPPIFRLPQGISVSAARWFRFFGLH